MNRSRQSSATTNIDVRPASVYESDCDDEFSEQAEPQNAFKSVSTFNSTAAESTTTDQFFISSINPILVPQQPLPNTTVFSTRNSASHTAVELENDATNSAALEATGILLVFWIWFKRTHFKNGEDMCKDLVLFRILSILGIIVYTIIDTIMYSSTDGYKSSVLLFLHGSRYLALEIFTVIYASGVPAFGVSIEIYILIPYAIGTCILTARNCGGPIVLTGIFWIFKVVFLLVAIEVVHRNFRELKDYKENYKKSSRAMLRQALWFSVTMLFLSASGLKALYNAIDPNSLLFCAYDRSHCGIIDLYVPNFTYANEKCSDDIKEYVAGREQLRVLRNHLLLNGVSYAIFNCNWLDIEHGKEHIKIRIVLVLLCVGLATSVLVSYIDTLYFIEKCRLPYNIMELIIFIILFVLPAINLFQIRRRNQRLRNNFFKAIINVFRRLMPLDPEVFQTPMDDSPKVLP